jgi:hypothetical protein
MGTLARLFLPRLIRLVAQNVVTQAGGFLATSSSENWGVSQPSDISRYFPTMTDLSSTRKSSQIGVISYGTG